MSNKKAQKSKNKLIMKHDYGQLIDLSDRNAIRDNMLQNVNETGKKDLDATLRLIYTHNLVIDSVIHELTTNTHKINHYIWWIFPTELMGANDMNHTRITEDTYDLFLNNINSFDKWLDLIYFIFKHPEKINSGADINRIGHFKVFWIPKLEEKIMMLNQDFNYISREMIELYKLIKHNPNPYKNGFYIDVKERLLACYILYKRYSTLKNILLMPLFTLK